MKQPHIAILSEARAGIILAGGSYHAGCEALNDPKSPLWETVSAWVRAKDSSKWDTDDCKALRLEIFRLVKGWARAHEKPANMEGFEILTDETEIRRRLLGGT